MCDSRGKTPRRSVLLRVAAPKTLHLPCRIHDLLLPGEEGMAARADLDPDFLRRGACRELVPARTADLRVAIRRMNIRLHGAAERSPRHPHQPAWPTADRQARWEEKGDRQAGRESEVGNVPRRTVVAVPEASKSRVYARSGVLRGTFPTSDGERSDYEFIEAMNSSLSWVFRILSIRNSIESTVFRGFRTFRSTQILLTVASSIRSSSRRVELRLRLIAG